VAHPVLHGPYIESPSQHSRRIGRTKCLQIKLCRVEFGALRDRFAVIEHVLFPVSRGGRKHKLAVRTMRMLPKLFDEFYWSGNFTIFPSLRVESQFPPAEGSTWSKKRRMNSTPSKVMILRWLYALSRSPAGHDYPIRRALAQARTRTSLLKRPGAFDGLYTV